MTVKELLKEYRNYNIEDLLKHDDLKHDDPTYIALETLFAKFEKTDVDRYKLDPMNVVRLYYKGLVSISTISKMFNVSEKEIRKMRDDGVKHLQDLLD